ncbi:hypothetical protein Pcinc_023476 [Petrolisthes cinctipes]|uniref:Uncharacterized protein n=1 Tax=Petrolisthes cinctipes TaxID=88211 RepID=A0AAE1FBR7_PETCI|nr:hypothetical protein Pcinc_023476 [Petrolisthes cinctipes]
MKGKIWNSPAIITDKSLWLVLGDWVSLP